MKNAGDSSVASLLQNDITKISGCHSERSEESQAFFVSPRIADTGCQKPGFFAALRRRMTNVGVVLKGVGHEHSTRELLSPLQLVILPLSTFTSLSVNSAKGKNLHEGMGLKMKRYFVYIMTNKSKTLYTGVTNNLERRIWEHKNKQVEGFTQKYNITKLVWFDETNDVRAAIEKEKEIKGWLRKKKIRLIESVNPEWKDLSEGFYTTEEDSSLRSE